MEQVKDIASLEEVLVQLESLQLSNLMKDMERFAVRIMRGNDIVIAEKLVGEMFIRAIDGTRKWNKKYSFKHFLFDGVKSLVSQYNNKYGEEPIIFNNNFDLEQVVLSDSDDSVRLEALKAKLSEILKSNIPPPDDIEEIIFECWMDDIKKPAEISKLWGIDIKEVYKAIKRLERKLNPIIQYFNNNKNE